MSIEYTIKYFNKGDILPVRAACWSCTDEKSEYYKDVVTRAARSFNEGVSIGSFTWWPPGRKITMNCWAVVEAMSEQNELGDVCP